MMKVKIALTHLMLLLFAAARVEGMEADTLQGFKSKVEGEEIKYYSPLHEFASTALLTRCNGKMPVKWEAPAYTGECAYVVYEVLTGHSSGTSGNHRHFEVKLNGRPIFILETQQHNKNHGQLSGKGEDGVAYTQEVSDYDPNGDAFGSLYIKIPAALAREKAVFEIRGIDENSRDWFMVFMYKRALEISVTPTQLVTRIENKRQLNFLIDNPYKNNTPLQVKVMGQYYRFNLMKGYNKLRLPAYDVTYKGTDNLVFIVNQRDTVYKTIDLKPVQPFDFHIIHHSHNDIGYSHLQAEVEQLQNNNIYLAMDWTDRYPDAYWHIESLWAVENFYNIATTADKERFIRKVKEGRLVLSANYANILTGLVQGNEHHWTLEFARQLEKENEVSIRNVMTTDIPGISKGALKAYTDAGIPWLSMGPNYVSSQADEGDRVGGVIKEQGDQIYYWKEADSSKAKLLVWTAGKGYSLLRGITENNRQEEWEKRISKYCEELVEKGYPYPMVQLRYTYKSDNGVVDTALTAFVKRWNKRYLYPRLQINSLDKLFETFEKQYGNTLPVKTGEISPYWEDGAYSTAVEEMQIRELVPRITGLEQQAEKAGMKAHYHNYFYRLRRSVVMFHEHTWGSWCSISDPELFFTTDQWRVKKAFADSAQYYYKLLSDSLKYTYKESADLQKYNTTDITADELHGGLKAIYAGGRNLCNTGSGYAFFEPVYVLGINKQQVVKTKVKRIKTLKNNSRIKELAVVCSLPTMDSIYILYTLNKKSGLLICRYSFDKKADKKNKESMHIAMPMALNNASLLYGNNAYTMEYGKDQLPGSNREFICTEEGVWVMDSVVQIKLESRPFALWETGQIIDENQLNGAKVWKRESRQTNQIFLYVFNNYWHTNYKAYQDGKFDFEIKLKVKIKQAG